MGNHIWLENLNKGDRVDGYYALSDAVIRQSKNGEDYLAGKLTDRTGSIMLRVWSYGGPVDETCNGSPVYVSGAVSEYNGELQIKADVIRIPTDLEAGSYNISDLVQTAPIDSEQTAINLLSIIDTSIMDNDYKAITKSILKKHIEVFKTCPAAKSNHHAFVSGLLMHTYNMARVASMLADAYWEVINKDLLLAGTILHDICKVDEFELSNLGMVKSYTLKGNLLGHLAMGVAKIEEEAKLLGMPEEKMILLQHLIASHHGRPEYGAILVPMCAEAQLLHLIDMIDSRMEVYSEAYQNINPGEFSQGRVKGLDNIIYRPSI